jgi:hypothetical protein
MKYGGAFNHLISAVYVMLIAESLPARPSSSALLALR